MSSSSSTNNGEYPTRPKLPTVSIPDMRFEQSYLASVRSFIHEHEHPRAHASKLGETSVNVDEPSAANHVSGAQSSNSQTGEPELWLGNLRIEW